LRDIDYSYKLTTIESSAFEGCSSVTDFKDFGLITSIGYAAFSGCTGLTEVVIPKSVTSIGGSAFFNCRNLKRVIFIGENVTSIGSYAFRYCDKLTDVVIPDKVSEIATFAFADCSSLKSVTLPKNLTSIGYAAFYKCAKLENVEIPAGVTKIKGFAFADCHPCGGEQAFCVHDLGKKAAEMIITGEILGKHDEFEVGKVQAARHKPIEFLQDGFKIIALGAEFEVIGVIAGCGRLIFTAGSDFGYLNGCV
jgi:hypothetical protein